MDGTWLPYFWAVLIAFSIIVYVVLDGFDLGVGILFGTTRDAPARATMMNAIAPFWDGNETWLILIGASLFGAFPVIYAVFLPAFYLPVALMLLGLIFRGVAFEFRYRTERMRWLWDLGFFFGSLIVAFVQGAAIGAMAQAVAVADRQFAGGSFDWLTPFSVFCGVGLAVGYALLGASWLAFKTSGHLQEWAYRRIGWLSFGVLVFLVGAFYFVLANQPLVMERWSTQPSLMVFPFYGLIAAIGLVVGWRRRGPDGLCFAMSVVIFIAAFLTLVVSFWPYMIPFSLTIEDAAAPTASLEFLYYGAGIVVFPAVLIYTVAVYWIFRGKVRDDANYQ